MIIDILLPYKEIFSHSKASAVSLTIKNSAEFSKYKKNINVYGQFAIKAFTDVNFIGLKTNKFLHLGNNKSLLINYIKKIEIKNKEKRILEMHNRPYVFNLAIRKKIKLPISLHFHNDPREMKGSKTIKERVFIAKNAAAIYFVSEYIKNCFLDGIEFKFKNLFVIPNGIQRILKLRPIKEKKIIFIGRLVPEKGCHLFVNAVNEIAKDFEDWEFLIIGTPKAGDKKLNSSYSKNVINNFININGNTKYLGFVENSKVKKILEKTSILVVPSIWEEPFALTALEGMCSGAAVIASKVGGMREMLYGVGLLISEIDEKKLKKSILKLILDNNLLKKYQDNSWNNYKFNQTDIVKKQDDIRSDIFKNYNY